MYDLLTERKKQLDKYQPLPATLSKTKGLQSPIL